MKKKIKAMIISMILCISLTAVSIGATELPQDEPAETAEAELTDSEVAEPVEAVSEIVEEPAEAETEDMEIPEEIVTEEICETDSDLLPELTAQRYLFLGDSTTCGYGDRNGNRVTPFTERLQGMRPSVIDCRGVGGATYTNRSGNNVIAMMTGLDLTDYDAVFLLYGVNDFSVSSITGNVNDNKVSTVCGALNMAISRCNNANVKCYVILPFPCESQYTGKTNAMGDTYQVYLNAIKSVCSYRNTEIIDFNTSFGINGNNFYDYYVDNIHPGNNLQAIAAEYLNNFLGADNDSELATRLFVNRLYLHCLLRTPDAAGEKYWVDSLKARKITGVETAKFFFFSPEFESQKHSDQEYIELLYTTLLDRPSDADGLAYWMGLMDSGVSREGIFKGFADSKEFQKICNAHGIEKGVYTVTQNRDVSYGLTQFVSRLYTKALNRKYDVDGLNYWCGEIKSNRLSVVDVSTSGFFHSKEFKARHLTQEEYITVLYRTFLGREPEADGFNYWKKQMSNGMTEDEMLIQFANSPEFSKIKKSFGL